MPPRSTNWPKPRVADEGAVADDRAAADEDRADRAGDLEALVRRVVAGVVQVGGADRSPRGRVEQHEVGIAPDLDRALAREAEQARRRRRQQVDHALDRDPALRDALASRRSRGASRCPARRC